MVSVLEKTDIARDPIHGYIELTEEEKALIKTLPFLRLMRLNPTPAASFVYVGCSGNRLAHSLGVKHLAGMVAERLVKHQGWKEQERIVKNIRLAGLLHDVGHGPFSHAFDYFLEMKGIQLNHEKVGFYLLNSHKELTKIVKDEKLRLEIAYIAWGKETLRDLKIERTKIEQIQKELPFIDVLSDIIHGAPHCVDILDFLVRDSYYAGVEYGLIDVQRLIMFMDVYRGRLAIENRAFEAYESMVMARFNMYRTVYWHRTSRAIDMVLLKAIEAVDDYLMKTQGKGLTDVARDVSSRNVNDYMRLDDCFVFCKAKEVLGDRDHTDKSQRKAVRNLLYRNFPKMAYRRPEISLRPLMDQLKRGMGFKTDQEVFDQWKKLIIKDLKRTNKIPLEEENLIIDTPSLPFLPVHGEYGSPSDVVFFERTRKKKRLWRIPEDSILQKMNKELLEFRVYVIGSEKTRNEVRKLCEARWGKAEEQRGGKKTTRKRGTQA